MYIHLYTTATSTSDDKQQLEIYWYSRSQEDQHLFADFEHILQKYKEYGCISSYTGDILEVTNEQAFQEQLTMLGIIVEGEAILTLQDSMTITVNYGTTTLGQQFNDLYYICFGDYDIINTFSSEKNSIIQQLQIQTNKEIIQIPFINSTLYTTKIPLKCISYTLLNLTTPNNILNKWFNYFSGKKNKESYNTLCKILDKLYEKSIKTENSTKLDKSEGKSENKSKGKSESKSEDKVWVEEFCQLYAEKDEKTDTLLSDIYQQYVTASSWTKIEPLGMTIFIRYLKELPQFIIKRKAKGMVVIGYKFLVAFQEEMYNKSQKGQIYERNLLEYINNKQINYIEQDLKVLGIPKQDYYLEATILLHRKHKKLTKTILDQFINNPYIAKSLVYYSEYIKEVIKNTSPEKSIGKYREMSDKCVIFNPFSKNIYNPNIVCKAQYNEETTSSIGDINAYNSEELQNNLIESDNKSILDRLYDRILAK